MLLKGWLLIDQDTTEEYVWVLCGIIIIQYILPYTMINESEP